MKCDELKSIRSGEIYNIIEYEDCYRTDDLYYPKSEVDAVIEELKAKLEDAKATAYAESVDAGMRDRRLKRALWLARAERAHAIVLIWNVYCYLNNCLYYRDFLNEKCNPFRSLPKKTAMEWSDLWESIETKLRAKVEEYK